MDVAGRYRRGAGVAAGTAHAAQSSRGRAAPHAEAGGCDASPEPGPPASLAEGVRPIISDEDLALEYWGSFEVDQAARLRRNARLDACRYAVAAGRQIAGRVGDASPEAVVRGTQKSWGRVCHFADVPEASFREGRRGHTEQDMGELNVRKFSSFFQVHYDWLQHGRMYDNQHNPIIPTFLEAAVRPHQQLLGVLIYHEFWGMLTGGGGRWGRWHDADEEYLMHFDRFFDEFGIPRRLASSEADVGMDKPLAAWLAIRRPRILTPRICTCTAAEYARIQAHLRGWRMDPRTYRVAGKGAWVDFEAAFRAALWAYSRASGKPLDTPGLAQEMLALPELPEVPVGPVLQTD